MRVKEWIIYTVERVWVGERENDYDDSNNREYWHKRLLSMPSSTKMAFAFVVVT
jgi:hypothetical protein